jgi:hypothetical protein
MRELLAEFTPMPIFLMMSKPRSLILCLITLLFVFPPDSTYRSNLAYAKLNVPFDQFNVIS